MSSEFGANGRHLSAREVLAMRHKRDRAPEAFAWEKPIGASTLENENLGQHARLIRIFQHSLVPGLFQTEEYARTLTKKYPETTDDMVKERVEARLQRQSILFREEPEPPRVQALLDEQLLRRNVGGPAVMAPQMEHLARLARMPRITIQIIPREEAHVGLLGAFVVADTARPPAILYTDSVLGGQVIESAAAAEKINVVFRALQAEALPVNASLTKIEEAARRWTDWLTS